MFDSMLFHDHSFVVPNCTGYMVLSTKNPTIKHTRTIAIIIIKCFLCSHVFFTCVVVSNISYGFSDFFTDSGNCICGVSCIGLCVFISGGDIISSKFITHTLIVFTVSVSCFVIFASIV